MAASQSGGRRDPSRRPEPDRHCRFRWEEKGFHWTKRLHLPLFRTGDGDVDMVQVGQHYEIRQGAGELLLPARPDELTADRRTLAAAG